jgi:predicted DNA-binding antitoxin AbrB/MazE fold protein
MTFHTDAIFEGGVLHPLIPLDLKEHEVVSLSISTTAAVNASNAEVDRQRKILLAYVAKVESRPDDMPRDGMTNRDRDRLIYGK